MEKGVITNGGRREERLGPLLDGSNGYHSRNKNDLARRVWIESKKLWHTAGPGIFNRISAFSITVSTQAFAGHLGNLELASVAISINVFFGFSFGLMVRIYYNILNLVQLLCSSSSLLISFVIMLFK